MFEPLIRHIREYYETQRPVALHEPIFAGNEKAYLCDCIDSTFVSSVGKYVDQFERMVADFTGAAHAVATVNGTAALHIALKLVGVTQESEVITQPLTFIATCNAISYCGALPVFVDVDRHTLGMSPLALQNFLETHAVMKEGVCYNRGSGRRIAAVVPMHTFGHPCDIVAIGNLCRTWNIPLVEDAAESLGSYVGEGHTGTFGSVGVLSFNGNKTITTGGGGMIITNDSRLSQQAKHLTTTAKVPHPYEYVHDAVGYNYRLPNINAALGVAQMEQLEHILKQKRLLAHRYHHFCTAHNVDMVTEPKGTTSNYWLNAIILEDRDMRDRFLAQSNAAGIMTRPIWTLMNKLEMFSKAQCGDLSTALWLEERVVNLPSGIKGVA